MAKELLSEQLAGAWRLEAFEQSAGGARSFPFGRDAQGLLLLTRGGHMAVSINARGRKNVGMPVERLASLKKFDPRFLKAGTVYMQAALEYIGFAGRYWLEDGYIHHAIDVCSYPDWCRDSLRRNVTLAPSGELQLDYTDALGRRHALRWSRAS